MIIAITLAIPAAIFAEAGLSFLGIGINEPVPSLGKMVADSRQYIQLYWHLGFFPTLAIALAVLGFAFVGDGLRDALDPRQILGVAAVHVDDAHGAQRTGRVHR